MGFKNIVFIYRTTPLSCTDLTRLKNVIAGKDKNKIIICKCCRGQHFIYDTILYFMCIEPNVESLNQM